MTARGYVDSRTGRRYALDPLRWCGDDGAPLDLEFTAPALDWSRVRTRAATMWRYREALPLEESTEPVALGEPITPLAELAWQGAPLALKLDQLFASGSYKDRGAAVLVSRARAWGIDRVVADSSGNAGSAIAAYCARVGIACTVYVPGATPVAKLAQMEIAGAHVVRVDGDREAAANAAREAATRAFYASHCWNAHFFHGTKTIAYELYEQTVLEGALGGRLPDVLIIPAGNGTLLLGAALGLAELVHAGSIERAPALWAVQARACNPLERAFDPSATTVAQGPTVAEGVAIAHPPRLAAMLDAVHTSGGAVISVRDDEVLDAMRSLAHVGLCVEPTAAVSVAAVTHVRAKLGAGVRALAVITGHGLKAPDKLASLAAHA